jgi:hypothetical protein
MNPNIASIRSACDALEVSLGQSWPASLDCWNPLTNNIPLEFAASDVLVTRMTDFARMQPSVRDGSVLLFGDSNFSQLPASSFLHCQNYAVGGQDTRQFVLYMNGLTSNRRAGALVIGVGVCDLGEAGKMGQNGYVPYPTVTDAAGTVIAIWNNYIIPRMRSTGKYVVREIIPVNESLAAPITNAAVEQINAFWRATFSTWPNVRVVSATGISLRDGLHADDAGNGIQIERINSALLSLGIGG